MAKQVNVRNKQYGQPRSRVVGGSPALNFSVVAYPSVFNFEAWGALGNVGWGAEYMAPYLRKFHTYIEPRKATAPLLDWIGT